MAKVYDCFIFNNELDFLEIRLQELWDDVDYFVLCESRYDWTGWLKPLWYQDNKSRFANWHDKIITVELNSDVPQKLPLPARVVTPENEWDPAYWANETHQRNALWRGITNAEPDDLIMVSDADEIPSRHIVNSMPNDLFRRVLICQDFSYNFNLLHPVCGGGNTSAVRHRRITADGISPTAMRDLCGVHSYAIQRAGWHFNWFGGRTAMVAKEQTYPHIITSFANRSIVGDPLSHNVRGESLNYVDDILHLPEPVRSQLHIYTHLFDNRFVVAHPELFEEPK